MHRKIVVGALVLAGIFALSTSADAQQNNKLVTVNGCKASLFSATVTGASSGVQSSYSETWRENTASCSLATYNKYHYYGTATIYTTSTVWSGTWAYKYAPDHTNLNSSRHFVNYSGPTTGKWYTLP